MELFAADGHDAGGCERVTGKSGMRPRQLPEATILGEPRLRLRPGLGRDDACDRLASPLARQGQNRTVPGVAWLGAMTPGLAAWSEALGQRTGAHLADGGELTAKVCVLPFKGRNLFIGHGRVDDWRGGGRRMGVAVPGGFRAGASLPAVAPFPVAAHRTGRADFPQPALGRDHAFAHGKLVVRTARRVSPYSFQSRSSGNRTNCPDRTLCLRQSHWRSRRVACRSIAA